MFIGVSNTMASIRTILFNGGVLLLLIPSLAFADLVTCEGAQCRTCDIVYTANGVISWLVGIMASLCTLVVLYSGAKMVMASGDVGAIESAKGRIWDALIGFVILLSAWLLVDTILKILVVGNDQTSSTEAARLPGLGPWNEVICSESPIATPIAPPATVESGEGITTGTTPCDKIQPLTPLTDPQAIQMEGGASVIFNNSTLQACANKFIGMVGGRVTSAYRPQPYQTHLWEIRDRWCTQGLRANDDPQCSSLKSQIASEVSKHFGSSWNCGAVAQNASSHGAGTGVDISGVDHGTQRVIDAAAASCLSWANYPGDPWHYNLRSGCTCN